MLPSRHIQTLVVEWDIKDKINQQLYSAEGIGDEPRYKARAGL